MAAVAEINARKAVNGTLRISTEKDGVFMAWEQEVELAEGLNTVELAFEMKAPKLWWSRGLGDQERYTFAFELLTGHERDSIRGTVKTGLRNVRLVREKDEAGTSFYVELNSVPVFCKGANHIPNDSFLSEVTEERYLHEIATAAESNMNMLRVWGGGVYEDNRFYELCDEYGIMVWQDFMFACSMYPGDEAFLASVRQEAEDNIRRLRNHPSIVLWCGNNEIDSAWAHYLGEGGGWGWKRSYTPEQRETIWADYEAVFHRVLPEEVDRWAKGAEYWPSSPITALSGDAEQHAHPATTAGDVHYWGVWHNKEPFDNYKVYVGRFLSEYGFQSFPELRTVKHYAEPSDMELESPVMLAHQKNGAGNQLIKTYMGQYMKEPKDFPAFLHMSQLLQAEAMKMAIEAHRRKMPVCMGSLYWQINDCWPVASWASMDYYGRWKALQYYAKRSFEDTIVSIEETEGVLSVFVVSDQPSTVKGTIVLKLLDFSGKNVREWSVPADMAGSYSTRVFVSGVSEMLEGCDPSGVVLTAQLEHDGIVLAEKEHYFVRDKELKLSQPVITVKEEKEGGVTSFVLETDTLARQVWLSAETEGIFSDNAFDLLPGVRKRVSFRGRGLSGTSEPFSPATPSAVLVQSIYDFIQ